MSTPCVCGADLAAGWSMGVQVHGGVSCEFRTCRTCRSTRALMPPVTVAGRHIGIYRDPETSEVDWEGDSLLDALDEGPTAGAEIIRCGVVLAKAETLEGEIGWAVQPPCEEYPWGRR